MPAEVPPPDVSPAKDRAQRRAVLTFFVAAITFGGCMFCFKLFSFLKTIKRDELAGFAYDPIVVYGFVAVGFLFLLAYAFLSGQFRDIEETKREMLTRFYEQEQAEFGHQGVSTQEVKS